jgi:hypothetical protein
MSLPVPPPAWFRVSHRESSRLRNSARRREKEKNSRHRRFVQHRAIVQGISGTYSSGGTVWRRFTLIVGNARATRGLFGTGVAGSRHLAHPVGWSSGTRAGAIERPRSGRCIGCGRGWDRQRTGCDRGAHRRRQLRGGTRRERRYHQWIGRGRLRASYPELKRE